MNFAELFFIGIAFLFLMLVAAKLLSSPLRLTLQVIANTVIGLLSLIALDLYGPILGIHVAVTFFNALFVGILGLPGLVLLALMQWVFQL